MNKLLGLINNNREAIPNVMHFVWIGEISIKQISYIEIWHKVNQDKKINIWVDNNSTLFNKFNYVFKKNIDTNLMSIEDKIKLSNNIYYFFMGKIKNGFTYNEAAVNACQYFFDETIKNTSIIPNSDLGIEFMDINDLPLDNEIKKFYYYELILRANLASCSDLIRLKILSLYGGIYIDVDTLPMMSDKFNIVRSYLLERGIHNEKNELVVCVLCLNRSMNDNNLTVLIDEIIINKVTSTNTVLIFKKIASKLLFHEMFSPIGEMKINKSLINICSDNFNKGFIGNNILGCHVNSKVINIIIRQIKKRYKYLENNDLIFKNADVFDGDYLARLANYRKEMFSDYIDRRVTHILTGPGLFIEVLLGLVYTLPDVENISLENMSNFLLSKKLGLVLNEHTMNTPESKYNGG